MPSSRILTLSALLALLSTVSSTGNLESRNPYYGGFALPGKVDQGAVNGCPANTLTCADPDAIFVHCCPMFTFCGPYQPGAYCCPTSDDCNAVVNAEPTCAEPGWTLYEDAFIWCCQNDTIGVAEGDGDCLPKTNSYSFLAKTLTQGNNAPPPSSWAGGIIPSGLSTSSPAAATTTNGGATNSGTAAGTSPTGGQGAAATTAANKPGTGTTLGFSIVLGGIMFTGTLLLAALL